MKQVSANLCQSIYKIEKDTFEVAEEDECVSTRQLEGLGVCPTVCSVITTEAIFSV